MWWSVSVMSKSNHQKYLRKLNDEYELIRPIGNPITKFDVLRFKRYEYTTPSIDKIGDLIKDNLNSSMITGDIKRKYPSGHPRWEEPLVVGGRGYKSKVWSYKCPIFEEGTWIHLWYGKTKEIVFVLRHTTNKVYGLDGTRSVQHKEIHYFWVIGVCFSKGNMVRL